MTLTLDNENHFPDLYLKRESDKETVVLCINTKCTPENEKPCSLSIRLEGLQSIPRDLWPKDVSSRPMSLNSHTPEPKQKPKSGYSIENLWPSKDSWLGSAISEFRSVFLAQPD